MMGAWLEVRRLAVIGNALVGAALVTVVLASAGESLQAENAWVPWAPPGLKVHVVYMTIVNRGATDRVIVGAESTDYELATTADQIAAAVQFLLSPDAAFCCGSVLFVDGGTDAMLRPDSY